LYVDEPKGSLWVVTQRTGVARPFSPLPDNENILDVRVLDEPEETPILVVSRRTGHPSALTGTTRIFRLHQRRRPRAVVEGHRPSATRTGPDTPTCSSASARTPWRYISALPLASSATL